MKCVRRSWKASSSEGFLFHLNNVRTSMDPWLLKRISSSFCLLLKTYSHDCLRVSWLLLIICIATAPKSLGGCPQPYKHGTKGSNIVSETVFVSSCSDSVCCSLPLRLLCRSHFTITPSKIIAAERMRGVCCCFSASPAFSSLPWYFKSVFALKWLNCSFTLWINHPTNRSQKKRVVWLPSSPPPSSYSRFLCANSGICMSAVT